MLAWSCSDATVTSAALAAESGIDAQTRANTPPPARSRWRAELWFVSVLVVLSTALFGVFGWLALDALTKIGWPMLPFTLMIGGLFYCALAYQVIRWGTAQRARSVAQGWDTGLLKANAPEVTVLIPSFQESRRVVIGTALSAALATYRNKRIVVLVDDPPDAVEALSETLQAIETVRDWLREASTIRDAALAKGDRLSIALAYADLAEWVDATARALQSESDPSFAHVDDFMVERVLNVLSSRYRNAARCLIEDRSADVDLLRDALCCIATGDIQSFQRKSYANLTHAPNKAMNLNAYLGLMGKGWKASKEQGRTFLIDAPAGTEDFLVDESTYVLTLDADSVILPDYILALVSVLEQTPSAAVAQTPYLSFPGGLSPVERIAGATTDIQHLIHQGSGHYGAAYWVGANAILRMRALHDIATFRQEGEAKVTVFVQDKTVIEDTGSTIDLHDRGWHVHNHFDPMAFSATPADFGALAIQRKRWANGGLILFIDLLRSHFRHPRALRQLPRLVVQSHYLLSPAIGNIGILGLMLLWTSTPHAIFWTPLFMVPYFLLYMADLERMGYRWWELFGVSSLNLMLLPVNLAGILASLWQMLGGQRHKFVRTPKLATRTFIPPYAFLFNLAILLLMIGYVVWGLVERKWLGTVIPALNVLFYSYGMVRFIGLRDGFHDLLLRCRQVVRLGAQTIGGAISASTPASDTARLGNAGQALLSSAAIPSLTSKENL